MTFAILYTNSDSVRSAAGLDDSDVDDAMLSSLMLEEQMLLDLSAWYPDHEANSSSDDSIASKLSLYCMWFGALRIVELQLAVANQISDGKNTMKRFAFVDWETLKNDLKAKLNSVKTSLSPPVVVYSMVGKATPAYNPITG